MTDRIRLRWRPGEIEAAAIVGGALADYALYRPGRPDGVGDTHVARAGRRVAAMAGCFVPLVDEAADGFLPDRECDGTPPGEGAPVTVRLIRAARGGKGARLTLRGVPQDNSGGPPGRRSRGSSAIDELRARFPLLAVETADPAVAAAHGAAVVRAHDDDAIDDAIAGLRERDLVLPGGLRATIEPTEALVAIDLDTAGGTAGDRALFAANRDAMAPLLHQVRLRNLSGAIVVDAAGLPARKRAALAPAIAAALAADPLAPRLLGISALGFAEIVRARRRPALHELFASPHGRALDAGEALLAAGSAAAALVASPALAAAMEADAALRADLARATGRPLMLRTDPRLPGLAWRIDPIEEERR